MTAPYPTPERAAMRDAGPVPLPAPVQDNLCAQDTLRAQDSLGDRALRLHDRTLVVEGHVGPHRCTEPMICQVDRPILDSAQKIVRER